MLVCDGKTFAGDKIVIALGVSATTGETHLGARADGEREHVRDSRLPPRARRARLPPAPTSVGGARRGEGSAGRRARCAGQRVGQATSAPSVLGEARVVENNHRVALGGEREHFLDALRVQIGVVADHFGQEVLQLLLARARHDLGKGAAILVGGLGLESAYLALQHLRHSGAERS